MIMLSGSVVLYFALSFAFVTANIHELNEGSFEGSFTCPHGHPVVFDKFYQFQCGLKVPCVDSCYNSQETCSAGENRTEFISSLVWTRTKNRLVGKTFVCCKSSCLVLENCTNSKFRTEEYKAVVPTINSKIQELQACSMRISHKKCRPEGEAADVGLSEESAPCRLRRSSSSKKKQKPGEPTVKFNCANSSPIEADGRNFYLNSLECGTRLPCTKVCYESPVCILTRVGGNDFISSFHCEETIGQEPYRCQFTCCNSNVTILLNCTWHYPTDNHIDKRGHRLAIRRVEYLPFIMEVCAITKNSSAPCSTTDDPAANGQGGNNWDMIDQSSPASNANGNPGDAGSNANGNSGLKRIIVDGFGAAIYVAASEAAASNPLALLGSLGLTSLLAIINTGGCGPIDLMFLVDSSASMLLSGFTEEKLFVTTAMGYFNFATSALNKQSRAGLITFGSSVVRQIGVDTYAGSATANSQLIAAVNSVSFESGAVTDTAGGVVEALNVWKTTLKRAGVRQATILITDGMPTYPTALTYTQRVAQLQVAISDLQSYTADTIYAIAITTDGFPLTTDFGIPPGYTFYAASASELQSFVPNVISAVCKPPTITTTTTATTSTSASTTRPTTTSSTTSSTTSPTTSTSTTSPTTTSSTTTTTTTTTTSTSTTTSSTTSSTTTTTSTTTGCIRYLLTGCITAADCCGPYNDINVLVYAPGCAAGQCYCNMPGIACTAVYGCCSGFCQADGICSPATLRAICWPGVTAAYNCIFGTTCTAVPATDPSYPTYLFALYTIALNPAYMCL